MAATCHKEKLSTSTREPVSLQAYGPCSSDSVLTPKGPGRPGLDQKHQ